jgi:hypothetical protein
MDGVDSLVFIVPIDQQRSCFHLEECGGPMAALDITKMKLRQLLKDVC